MLHSGYRSMLRTVLLTAALLLLLAGFFWGLQAFADFSPSPEAAEPQVEATSEDEADLPETLPEEWFDDALFIGDSITGALSTHTLLNGGLGDATIVHTNGLGCHHIVRDSRKIPIMGTVMPIEDAVSASGCGKLYLMLAMNDIGTSDIENLRSCWEETLGRIIEKNPDLPIFVQSGTPIRQDRDYFSQEGMDEYNVMLSEVCEEMGCIYVDITEGLVDETGYMKSELQADIFHMNAEGCAIWVENLRNPASYSRLPDLEQEDET